MTTVQTIKSALHEGILAFPATPFDQHNELDVATLEAHIGHLVASNPVALVPGGAAGELFSLTVDEYLQVLRTTVGGARGRVPVVAGIGFGNGSAIQMAKEAERIGADAVLVLPPYLINPEPSGLYEHLSSICGSIGIGVIVYHRDNSMVDRDIVLKLADNHKNFLGVKDGSLDYDLVSQLRSDFGEDILIINGAPTAEMFARKYRDAGVNSFSSAVFAFAPEIPTRFYASLRATREPELDDLISGFYEPLVSIRKRKKGYAVSIVKAGLEAVGRPAGRVRPPLVDCTPAEVSEIRALIRLASPSTP